MAARYSCPFSRDPIKHIWTTIRESLPAGPAVRRMLAYNSRGAPLTQSRKCLIREGAVALLNRLEVYGKCWKIRNINVDQLNQISGEYDRNREGLGFISCGNPESSSSASESPP